MAVFCRWIYQRWQRVCAASVSSLFHYSVGLKMKQCKHNKGSYECGSYAFNLHADNIDQGDLCDVHYWQDQAENSSADYTGWDEIPAGTELNTFFYKPDYDTQATLVEEMQRMAAELEAANEWIKKSEKIIADQEATLITQKWPTKIVGPNLVGILNAAGFYQKRPWVGLTNDEMNRCAAGCHLGKSVQDAIYQAAALIKQKNNG
jgi:hypothetical protein